MKKIISKSLFKQALIVFSGRVGAAGFGYIIILIVARILGPEQFGLYSFFVVLTILGSSLIGEAFAHAIVRNHVLYTKDKSKNASTVLVNALTIRVFAGMPVIIAGILFGNMIALTIFSDPQYAIPITLGCIGSFAMALWTFSLTTLQATESFTAHALLTPLVNLLRIMSIPILLSMGLFTLEAIIGVYVGSYLLCAVIAIWFLRHRLHGGKASLFEIKSQLSFSKWMALAIICQLLQTHLAIPILGYYSTKFAVGIFSAAATLLIVVDHITTAILTVQYPKVAKLDDLNSQISFVKQTLLFSLLIVLFLSPGLFIIEPIIHLLYGQEYVGSTPVFQILFIGLLSALISQPLNLLFLARNKSHYWSTMAIFSLLIWFIVGYFLIPKHGAVGAAWTTTIARFSNTVMTFTLLFRTLYVEKRKERNLIQPKVN